MTNEVSVMTYNSLLQNVSDWNENTNTDFLSYIPQFISLAEKQIIADIKTLWELKAVNVDIQPNVTFFSKPVRWRKTLSISTYPKSPVAGSTPQRIVATERSKEYITLIASEVPAGQPLHWADYDYDNWGIAPIPDQVYTAEIIYYEQAQPLSPENQENLITREAPQLMLYGTMWQASFYLKDFARMQQWQGMYQTALQALKNEDQSRAVDRNATVIQGA